MPSRKRPSPPPPLAAPRLRALLRTAREVAARTGEAVRRRHRSGGQELVRKGEGDFVTAVDPAAERSMRALLRAAHPDHGIVGEELPAENPAAEYVWVLDPIDGTSNFGRGLPTYAVSIACMHAGHPVAAAVHNLPEDVTYSAALGLGAFRSRRRLEMAARRIDDAAILGVQWHRGPRRLAFLPRLLATGARVRNLGCTVVQLCDVAAGRLDANIQEQGKLWDFAAAALIVTEAGGRFTGWDGDPIFPVALDAAAEHHPSLASHPQHHAGLCRILAGSDARPG